MVCGFYPLKHLPDKILSVLFLQCYLMFLMTKNNIVTFNGINWKGVKKEWKEEKEEEGKEE